MKRAEEGRYVVTRSSFVLFRRDEKGRVIDILRDSIRFTDRSFSVDYSKVLICSFGSLKDFYYLGLVEETDQKRQPRSCSE